MTPYFLHLCAALFSSSVNSSNLHLKGIYFSCLWSTTGLRNFLYIYLNSLPGFLNFFLQYLNRINCPYMFISGLSVLLCWIRCLLLFLFLILELIPALLRAYSWHWDQGLLLVELAMVKSKLPVQKASTLSTIYLSRPDICFLYNTISFWLIFIFKII